MTNKKVVLNFKNIVTELEDKGLKLCFLKGNGVTMLVQDIKENLYDIETYFHNSYLDQLIKDGARVSFYLIDDSDTIKNIKKFGKMEMRDATEIKEFINRQSKYW